LRAVDGSLLPVGGKTGTGDNRFARFGMSANICRETATSAIWKVT
jgi:hypothetical protein